MDEKSKEGMAMVFTQDFIKAFIQTLKSLRLFLCQPQLEFSKENSQLFDHAWPGFVLTFGELEAGLYWHCTFVH